MRSAAIIISGCLAMANADCGWTSNCGPRGCADCKDDGSAGYKACCGGGGGGGGGGGNCGWTSTCGPRGCPDCKDDGSAGFKACCGGGPSPPPGPTPPAGPVTEYCPDPATDFQIEVEPNAHGTVDWSSSGWTIHGQRRVSSKASFNLAGGYISWDMDLQGAQGNVNNNFYLTYNDRPNCGIDCYCDSGGSARGCAEMDLTENNGNCWQATTWHPNPSGSDHNGEAQQGGLSAQTSFKAEWDASGSHLDVHIGGNTHSGDGLSGLMSQKGAVIYSSQWTGWVPQDGRCGRGNLGSSFYTVKNLKIVGSVVTGPTPRLCNHANATLVV